MKLKVHFNPKRCGNMTTFTSSSIRLFQDVSRGECLLNQKAILRISCFNDSLKCKALSGTDTNSYEGSKQPLIKA